MILALGVLFFIGWLIYQVVFELDVKEGRKRRKHQEDMLKNIGKGTYIKLEWKYFCEFRDEAIKEYEEKNNEKVIVDTLNHSSVHWKEMLGSHKIMAKTQKKMWDEGYVPLLRYNYQLPNQWTYPDGMNWVETKADDEVMIWRLREKYEYPSMHCTNCILMELASELNVRIPISDDRNPYKIKDTKPKALIKEPTNEGNFGMW